MDKDNLVMQRIFNRFGDQRLESDRNEVLHQMLTAFILMIVGFLLAGMGLVAIIVRLVRLTGFSVFIFAQRIGLARRVNCEIERRHSPGSRRRPEFR